MNNSIEKRLKKLENSKNFLSQFIEHFTFYYKDGSILEVNDFENLAAFKVLQEIDIIERVTPYSNFIHAFIGDKNND